MIVLDTSILVDHLRGRTNARYAIAEASLSGERLVCSVVTRVEILAGMRPAEQIEVRGLIDSLEWLAVDIRITERAGMLANRWLPSHAGVDPVDFIIAATAEEHDAALWTRNLKHFPMFPDLRSPY